MNYKQLFITLDSVRAKEIVRKRDVGYILENIEEILVLKGFSKEEASRIVIDAIRGNIDKYKSGNLK